MKRLTKNDFSNNDRIVKIVNENVYNGQNCVIPEMISECDEYVFSKVKEAYPITDEEAIIKAVYLGPNQIFFVVIQDCAMGISVSIIKKEVIDSYHYESGSFH